MYKKIKKLSLFMVILFSMFLILTTSGYAINSGNSDFKIISESISADLKDYAIKELPKHIQNVMVEPKQYGFEGYDIQNFKLAEPFSVYKEDLAKVCYFPVTSDNKIVAVLGVSENSEKGYTSTFEKGFASKLQAMVENEHSEFRIVNNNNELRAVSPTKSIVLAKTYTDTNANQENKSKFNINGLTKNIDASDEKIINSNKIVTPLNEYNKINDNSYKATSKTSNSLPINIVLQGEHPWCWAATCASIINYEKGTHLEAAELVKFAYGEEIEKGGSWKQMKMVYNNWGLYPRQTVTVPYEEVKSIIDGGHPIHLGMLSNNGAHSMTLRGYNENSDGSKSYSLIDPNKDYYVSVNAETRSNQVCYILNGDSYYWSFSRLDF
ncbi:papain-like cysteine protease family protein [Clostridium ihumii]|uniref:papain-like cysteine protease family protein n=1 Tax=Clostridium ihumii TaxID=1470356 RepID=UPI00058D5D44|nr:papain-like cysteine protease family protein [Clostridium ihumii]